MEHSDSTPETVLYLKVEMMQLLFQPTRGGIDSTSLSLLYLDVPMLPKSQPAKCRRLQQTTTFFCGAGKRAAASLATSGLALGEVFYLDVQWAGGGHQLL